MAKKKQTEVKDEGLQEKDLKQEKEFTTPLQVDGKTANPLAAKLVFHNTNGNFTISFSLSTKQVSHRSADERKAMLVTLNELIETAIDRTLEIKRDWVENQSDPSQIKIGFDEN